MSNAAHTVSVETDTIDAMLAPGGPRATVVSAEGEGVTVEAVKLADYLYILGDGVWEGLRLVRGGSWVVLRRLAVDLPAGGPVGSDWVLGGPGPVLTPAGRAHARRGRLLMSA